MDLSRGYNRVLRKLLHIGGGLLAFLLPHGPVPMWIAISAVGVGLAFTLKPTHFKILRPLSKPRDRHEGRLTGARSYFGVLFLLGWIWLLLNELGLPGAVGYVMFGWMAMAWGDGLAGLVGPSPRRTKTVPWNPNKTWWGFAGCILGVLLAWLASWRWMDAGALGSAALLLGAAVSVASAFGESLRLRVDDNAVVGLGAPMLAFLLLRLLQAAA